MPPSANWRSAAAYAYLNDLNRAEFAWEFLRRNPDYQRDFGTAVRERTGLARFREELTRRWGLRFPRRSGSARG
jgi:hypothetical protein